ncbi:MAG TPA: hypothetical protein VMD59_14220 [Acidimicrobiales bacterium]|nr:hypothetical protein [Acidimicrobiales bacterium]
MSWLRARSTPSPCRSGPPWRGSPKRRSRQVGAFAAAVALALGASACAARVSGIGAPESPCFRSLPAASLAVHRHGRFAGVRFLSVAELASALRSSRTAPATRLPPALAHRADQICAVAYRGAYEPSSVKAAWPSTVPGARLAVVIVRQRDSVVLVTILLTRPPIGFSRTFPAIGRTPALR